ncbi:MAG: ferrous iron transport protein A [Thermogutta sp.]|uniref:FeoA family protein n=1 Tax=Thermogutta sp. TaxID=1962930 RepID=UPI00198D3538|nr:FeoA family protein [Thermogutta sp.]MBC7354362.1 ferrous iron transport protein A [Thermogutta sp.]
MIGFAWRRGKFWGDGAHPGETLLGDLQAGQAARITALDGPPEVVHRLQELGLRPGTVVRVFRPGNPCIVWLGGSKLGVRMDDDVRILVEALPGHHGHPHRHRHGWGSRPSSLAESVAAAAPLATPQDSSADNPGETHTP